MIYLNKITLDDSLKCLKLEIIHASGGTQRDKTGSVE
tara:strand:- start:307 stop:417 length:111 start_codon:yes stop_codon:yes gene_type:complete